LDVKIGGRAWDDLSADLKPATTVSVGLEDVTGRSDSGKLMESVDPS
jgi:hypothetical protein